MRSVAWLFARPAAVRARAAAGPARAASLRPRRRDPPAAAAARGVDADARPEAGRRARASATWWRGAADDGAQDEILARGSARSTGSRPLPASARTGARARSTPARASTCFAERVARLPGRGSRASNRPTCAAAIESALLDRGAARVGVPPGLLAGVAAEAIELVEDRGLDAARARRARRRRSRAAPSRSRRPGRSSSAGRRGRGTARALARPRPARLRRAERADRRARPRGDRPCSRARRASAVRSRSSRARRRRPTSSSAASRACTGPRTLVVLVVNEERP